MEALPCELGANKGKDKDKDKEEGAQSHMTKLIWGLENVDSHLLDTDQRTNTSSMLNLHYHQPPWPAGAALVWAALNPDAIP
jgi:hypothetical protein